ncbi:MAG: hypothetical protein HYU36_15575 [Planctomycetes bacterium]|nr:hypothetical protein [Planctomycetota bacterium]
MSAFNTLRVKTVCPSCKTEVDIRLQFKYGDTWQHEYQLGDALEWGGNDIGKPGMKNVALDAVAESCPKCGFSDIGDFEILSENDKLVMAQPVSGQYDFSKTDESFVVLEE